MQSSRISPTFARLVVCHVMATNKLGVHVLSLHLSVDRCNETDSAPRVLMSKLQRPSGILLILSVVLRAWFFYFRIFSACFRESEFREILFWTVRRMLPW